VKQPPGQLRDFAKEHLLYEVEMLRGLTEELIRVLDHSEAGGDLDELYPLAVRNAMVESFAVRARLLIDFLYGPGTPKPDDTLAEHYVAGDWHPLELPDGLQDVRRKVSKGVAHLTYHQLLEEETKGWQYGEIWLELAPLIAGFAKQASPELLLPEVAAKIIGLTDEPIDDTRDVSHAASVTHRAAELGVTTSSGAGSFSQDVPTTSVSEIVEQTRREQSPG
jgi:hypothetical protein